MVSVEPVPQRLQLMDVFMNTAPSLHALFNILSMDWEPAQTGFAAWGRHRLHAANISNTKCLRAFCVSCNVLLHVSLSGTSSPNSALARTLVHLILYPSLKEVPGDCEFLY